MEVLDSTVINPTGIRQEFCMEMGTVKYCGITTGKPQEQESELD